MTNTSQAVVFDIDGTLVDSFEHILQAYQYVARTFGYPEPTAEAVRTYLGQALPIPEIMRNFFPTTPIDDLLAANMEFIREHDISELFAGVEAMLQDLRTAGVKLAVLTASGAVIEDVLHSHNIHRYFTSIVHFDRVTFSKPHPEGFELAVKECGVSPEMAIMVGDAPNDILVGKNGHARLTVGITHGNASRESLAAADPDYIVDTIADLRQRLLTLVNQS
jgi:HAD superfamily hydrolase (TIGR01509 family)